MKTKSVCSTWQCRSVFAFILFISTLTVSGAVYAANWYIDNAVATSGNGQSWFSAFKDFSNISWSSIKPGDTLYISGGTTSKTYTSWLSIGADGTSTSKINIRVGQDAGHDGTVILDGVGIAMAAIDYVTIDGSVGTTSKLKIQNISNASKDNGWAINNGGSGGIGVTIRYITIMNCNNGINLTYADAFEVDHNSITVKGDAGIRAIANPQHGFGWNKIHDNLIYSLDKIGYGGPDSIQGSNSTDIYNNQFFAVASTEALQGQHPDSIQIGGVRYLRIYGNTFNNIADSNIDNDAFGSGQFVDIYIFNNLFIQTQNLDPYPDSIRFYSTGAQVNTSIILRYLTIPL